MAAKAAPSALVVATRGAPRGPRTARTGREREKNYTATLRKMPTLQVAGAQHFAMDAGEDVGEAPAVGLPAPLLKVLPQERGQQRIVEQIVDPALLVPFALLHDVVPQMVEQLVDIFSPLDLRVAEQVIEVPKLMCPPHAARTVLRAPQTADQLVEVPTIISCCSTLWSRKLPFQFVVVEGETLVFKVFFPDRVQQRRSCLWNALLSGLRSSSLVFLFLVEAFQIFRPGQVSSSSSHVPARVSEALDALFPKLKKVRSWVRTRVRGCPPVSAHPRWRLSSRMRPCRTPTSGCSSLMAARPLTGTDAPMRLSGSRLLASTWFGSGSWMRRGPRTTGTGIRVSVGMAFLLLLGDGQRGEELGIPSPLHQCHLWQDDVLVSCSFGGESGCIYSDMLENSCGIAVIAGWFCWYDAPRALFPSIVHDRCDSTGAVLGPGAMPVVVVSGADVQTAHYCVVSTGAVLGQVVQFPVVVQRLIPMVFCSEDHIFLLLPLNKMIDVPVALGRADPLYLAVSVRCSVFACGVPDFEFTYSALSGSTVDTCRRQSTRLLGVFTRLKREGAGPAVLSCRRGEDSRASTVAARRIWDSCCMLVVCNDRCCVVDDVAQFIGVGGQVPAAPRAVFLPVVRPQMRCIMAGMDQRYSCVSAWLVCLVLGQGRSHARCVQRHVPMVQTAENCAGSAVAVRVNVVVDISCRGSVADSHGPYHRDSPAAVHRQGDRCWLCRSSIFLGFSRGEVS